MRFEDILPALREGKKVRRKDWDIEYFICRDGNSIRCHDGSLYFGAYILKDDWEIYEVPLEVAKPKKKVKYYPGLFLSSSGHCLYSLYKDEQDVKNDVYVRSMQFMRLITEVPELIEEREE